MKKFGKILAVLLAGVFLAAAVGCGGGSETPPGPAPGGTRDPEQATKLTIFVASDRMAGTNEKAVKKAIEDKFWADTGNNIDLNVSLLAKNDFANTMTNVLASSNWDAAVSYIGIAGVDDNLIRKNAALDVKGALTEYGDHIKEKVDTLSSLTTAEGNIYGIPSVSESKQYGILVRRDWMHRVGYTNDPSETQYTYVNTIGQFEDMLRKMKSEIDGCKYPLIGAPWDLEYAVLPGTVEGYPSYAINMEFRKGDGSLDFVGPGYLAENYVDVLKKMSDWSKEELWEKHESMTTYAKRETWFTQGQGGVYIGNPKVTELIRIARNLKILDADAELGLLPPLAAGGTDGVALKDGNGNEIRAIREESRAYSGLVLNPRSENSELVIKYLDWMYSSAENYELCAYGIPGTDWVDTGAGRYSYPEGKEDLYLKNPSYSGGYKLLENINMSDRLLDVYTDQEKAWIAEVKTYPTYKSVTNEIFYTKPNDTLYNAFLDGQNNMVAQVVYNCWNGSLDPTAKHAEAVETFRQKANAYLEWFTAQYKLLTE